MSDQEFKDIAKKWLNNKIILSTKSDWYKVKFRVDAIYHVKTIFSDFLTFPIPYSIGQLAIKLKRHEDLLIMILPNTENPSYNNAVQTFNNLMGFAEAFIKQHNLQNLITNV